MAQPALKVVRPRDAASLVVLKHDGRGGAAVLMGRRPQRQSFMPDVFVFPGGAVDRGDARTPTATELRDDVTQVLTGHCAVSRARALAVAAVRETFEETGVFVGERTSGNDGTWQSLASSGRARLDVLGFLARAITPPRQPRRFHARFFVTDAVHTSGNLVGNGELLELGWFPLGEASRLPIAPVTELVLREAARVAAGEVDERGTPVFSRRHGKRMVRYDLGGGRVLRGLFEGSR
jgi:8-oxo-dGTP pyrophosphatase MutT (NUDIX family)